MRVATQTALVDDPNVLRRGERGTVDGRRVYLRCETCGTLLTIGRVWAVGQTVNDVPDNGRRPCHKSEDRD